MAMLVCEFDFTIYDYVHFQPKCLNSCNFVASNRAKQVRELLNKHFEQEIEQILTTIIWGHNGRVYYGIGPGMYYVINLNGLPQIHVSR